MGYSKVKYILSFTLLILYTTLYLLNMLDNVPNLITNIIWILFLIDIIKVMIPKFSKHSSSGKHLKKFYIEGDYKRSKLKTYIKTMNIRVAFTFTLYLLFLSVIGYLYMNEYINIYHIILIVVTLNFIDYFCINTWCVFHKLFIRNKCCNTCRIYNWDHFMKFGPFIFIHDFRALSLFTLATIALIQWEMSFVFHPERFSDISNINLRCSNCKLDCRFK